MLSRIVLLLILVVVPAVVYSYPPPYQQISSLQGCRDAISNCRQRFNSMNHHPYFCFRYGQSCKRFCQMCHSDCRDTWGYGYYCHGWRRRGQCRTSYAAKKCRKTCSFCRK